jgi:hypothetical protein
MTPRSQVSKNVGNRHPSYIIRKDLIGPTLLEVSDLRVLARHQIAGKRQLAARQFLPRADSSFAVINRMELVQEQ